MTTPSRDWFAVGSSMLSAAATFVYVEYTRRLVKQSRESHDQVVRLYRDALAPRYKLSENYVRRGGEDAEDLEISLEFLLERDSEARLSIVHSSRNIEIYLAAPSELMRGPATAGIEVKLRGGAAEKISTFTIEVAEPFLRAVDRYVYTARRPAQHSFELERCGVVLTQCHEKHQLLIPDRGTRD